MTYNKIIAERRKNFDEREESCIFKVGLMASDV